MDPRSRQPPNSAARAAAAKASWHRVHAVDSQAVSQTTSRHDRIPNTQTSFKPRRAIGRNSGGGRVVSDNTVSRPDIQNMEGSRFVSSSGKAGPPSMLDRPRSATGFEDYYEDFDTSARLRSMNSKEDLGSTQRQASTRQRQLSNFRERNCASAAEVKRYSDLQHDEHQGSHSRYKYHKHPRHTSYKSQEPHPTNGDKNNLTSDAADNRIQAFWALIGSPRSGEVLPSKPDMSRDRRIRSKSAAMPTRDERGEYVKFKAESSNRAGIREPTPLHGSLRLNTERDGKTELADDNHVDIDSYFSASDLVGLDRKKHLSNSSSHTYGESYNGNIEVASVHRDRNSPIFKILGNDVIPLGNSGHHFGSKVGFQIDRERIHESLIRESQLKDPSLTNDTCKQRRDPRRVIKRSPDRTRDTSKNSNNFQNTFEADYSLRKRLQQSVSDDQYFEAAPSHVDNEVLRYTTLGKDTSTKHGHKLSAYTDRNFEQSRPQSTLESTHTKSPHEGYTRPASTSCEPGRIRRQISKQFQSTVDKHFSDKLRATSLESLATRTSLYSQIDVAQGLTNGEGSTGSLSHSLIKREDSLKTHLNVLGASLSSLTSRLTSSSESDLRFPESGDKNSNLSQPRQQLQMSLVPRREAYTEGSSDAAESATHDWPSRLVRRQTSSNSNLSEVPSSLGSKDLINERHPSTRLDLVLGDDSSESDHLKADTGRHSDKTVSEEKSVDGRSARSSIQSASSRRDNGLSIDNLLSEKIKGHVREELRKMAKTITVSRKDHSDCSSFSEDSKSDLQSKHSSHESASLDYENENYDLTKGTSKTTSSSSLHELPAPVVEKDRPRRVISRTKALKAIHSDLQELKDSLNMSSQSTLVQSSRTEDAIHVSESPKSKEKRILVKRPAAVTPVSKSEAVEDISNLQTKSSASRKEFNNISPRRSKSSLAVLLNSDKSVLNSALPSKMSVASIQESSRPQTSLGVSRLISTKGKLSKETKPSSAANSPRTDATEKGKLLKQKVHKLHEDITKRLQSSANVSQNISTSLESLLEREKARARDRNFPGDGHDSDDSLSDASTIQNSLADGKQSGSDLFLDVRKGANFYSVPSSSLSSPKPGFTTSTPVEGEDSYNILAAATVGKERKHILRKLVRRLSKENVGPKHTSNDRNNNSEKIDRMISNGGRWSADLSREIMSHTHQRKKIKDVDSSSSNSDEVDSEKDDDHEREKDESHRSTLSRSESLGALHNIRVDRRGDVVGKILDKMSAETNFHTSSSRPASLTYHSQNWRTSHGLKTFQPSISGRASPADMLMGHLDNPQMVQLLKTLYKADPDTRLLIMVKFQYFKAWQIYSTESKEKRLKKEKLAAMAEDHLQHRLLCLHFITWWTRATHCVRVRKADAQWRRHTLSKGLRALRWSVTQSKHLEEKVKDVVKSSKMVAAFSKWKTRAVQHRRKRIETALMRWRRYVDETKKLRHMRNLMEHNRKLEVIRCWRELYSKRVKLNLAFFFFRRSLSRKILASWKTFVLQCKQETQIRTTAVENHQKTLVKTAFYSMLVSYKKSKKARQHFRLHCLGEVLWAWREAAQICRMERLHDQTMATDHRKSVQLLQCFSHWRERILVRGLIRQSNKNTCRSAFVVWRTSLQRNIERREELYTTLTLELLRSALLTWRQNVVQQRRRHCKAVALIEHCHMKQTFRHWRLYTARREILKKKMIIFNMERGKTRLSSSFALWKHTFGIRREEIEKKKQETKEVARTLATRWRLICKRRRLSRLCDSLQPVKNRRSLQALFTHWTASLARRRLELERADEMRERLGRQRVHICFRFWQSETRKVLLLKPLQQRLEETRLSETFESWKNFINKKRTCRANLKLLQKNVLLSTLKTWKRQLYVNRLAKLQQVKFSQGLLLTFVDAWRFVIQRKREADDFQRSQLTKRMFFFWRGRASFERDERARAQEEKEENHNLIERYFRQWLHNSRRQAMVTQQCVKMMTQKNSDAIMSKSFLSWRRHMHSVLIARAYQKSQGEKLVATLFLEWRAVASDLVNDAIHTFSERIGLIDHMMQTPSVEYSIGQAGKEDQEEEDQADSLMGSFNSVFSNGSSVRRLFGDTLNSGDGDSDRMMLLSGGLREAMNDHQYKCQRLKEISHSAIKRLMNWPTCLAFEQWREFTQRARLLKEVNSQFWTRYACLEQARYFREWLVKYRGMSRARNFWNVRLTCAAFESLRIYSQHRKHVKSLQHRAECRAMAVAGQKYFYPWLKKMQETRNKKRVLLLWTSATEEERRLLPLETHLTGAIHNRTLSACFYEWLTRYRALAALRGVLRRCLISWVFSAWQNWAEMKSDQSTKCEAFRATRRTRSAFREWVDKLHKNREVERRYHSAWRDYQGCIFHEWRLWAVASRRMALASKIVASRCSRRNVVTLFCRWRSLTDKLKSGKSARERNITMSVFKAWQETSSRCSDERRKALQFQVRSYTLLVTRLFHQWTATHRQRMRLWQDKQREAENKALAWGRLWRRKAQTSRGERLKAQLQMKKLSAMFHQWSAKMCRVQELMGVLQSWTSRHQGELRKQYLDTWRLRLASVRAVRLSEGRILLTFFAEWRIFAKERKDRKIRGLALKKALQERSLHVYFRYWVAMATVSKSIQQNVDLKLKQRVLHAWREHSLTRRRLRQVGTHVKNQVQRRILQEAFTNLRWRADYCSGLQDTVTAVLRDKERATMRAVLTVWRDRLDNILADRCYQHILTCRVAKRWHNFVAKQKKQRLTDEENETKAIKYHRRFLCQRIFKAIRTEVTVSKLAQKHRLRLCNECAMKWKYKVDYIVTAKLKEREDLIRRIWSLWRVEYTKRVAEKKISANEKTYATSLVFRSWRKKFSSIPMLYTTKMPQRTAFTRSSSVSQSMLPVPTSMRRASASSPSSPFSPPPT